MNIGFIGLGLMGAPVTAWPMGKNLTLGGALERMANFRMGQLPAAQG